MIVAVFAKPPVPGRVKTRLGRHLGHDRASALAAALLQDVTDVVASVPDVRLVIASTTDDPTAFPGPRRTVWDHGGGDLGARLERILRRGVAEAGGAMALGADTAALRPGLLRDAAAALRTGQPALAPAEDGGFVLLAVPQCPAGLLADLPWSHPTTGGATRARLAERLGPLVRLPEGFDVDEPEDLRRLVAEAAADPAVDGAAAALARRWIAQGVL